MKSSSNNILFQNPDELSITEAIQQLESKYIFKDRDEVIQFLTEHPTVVPLLEQIYPKLSQTFKLPFINLEFIDDPEEEGNEHVTAFIPAKEDFEQVVEEFKTLKRTWWIPILRTLPPEKRSLLNFNLGF